MDGPESPGLASPILLLPENALLSILRCQASHERSTGFASTAKECREFYFGQQVWAGAVDGTALSFSTLQSLLCRGSFNRCSELRILGPLTDFAKCLRTAGIQLPLIRLEVEGKFSECGDALGTISSIVFPSLRELTLHGIVRPWTIPGVLSSLLFSKLRALRIKDALDNGFLDTAELWVSDVYSSLEELCWTTSTSLPEYERRGVAHEFLRRLGNAMGPDFADRRAAFRVNVFSNSPLGPRLVVLCGLCQTKLFRSERIFALGPGSQSHIDLEAYLWGETAERDLPLYDGDRTQLNCCNRCHENIGLFLVARRGSFIDTCGFEFALACGKSLGSLHFIGVDDRSSLGNKDVCSFDEFLSQSGSNYTVKRRDIIAEIVSPELVEHHAEPS